MNNEQTQKTPGQVLYESEDRSIYLKPGVKLDVPLPGWHGISQGYRDLCEKSASAVISHVLQGAKYVLLEPGHRRQAGDEFWGGRSWIPTYPQHIGTPVDTTHLPYRRPISLPSSVRPEGKSEGPSTAPPASSGAVVADVPAAWKLPDPPAWMCWHRSDGWTQEMLPEGWRPLLKGERCKRGDEWQSTTYGGGKTWVMASMDHSSSPSSHSRTRRPLPQSAEPVAEETVAQLSDLLVQLGSLTSERDQLRKELEESERQKDIITDNQNGFYQQLRTANEKLAVLTTENSALKTDAAVNEAFKQQLADRLEAILPKVQAMETELTRLRSQFRWTPISERLPTEKDADKWGNVMWLFGTSPRFQKWSDRSSHHSEAKDATHWTHIPPLPDTSPPETEEQAMRREFEEWADKNDFLHQGAVTIAARAAWQAAKQSTGGAA